MSFTIDGDDNGGEIWVDVLAVPEAEARFREHILNVMEKLETLLPIGVGLCWDIYEESPIDKEPSSGGILIKRPTFGNLENQLALKE